MNWFERLLKKKPDQTGTSNPEPSDKRNIKPATTWEKPAGSGTLLRDPDSTPKPVLSPSVRPSVPHFSVGDRIADTYQVKRVIQGGMGTVYVAYHEGWKLDLVIKVPNQEILADPENAHRIEVEAEAWTELGLHPNIAYCYYVHPLDGVPLLVVEYLDGGNLRDWIADGRCADLKVGLDLAIQFCHGMEHAHSQGMIHRDIKPENIVMTKEGMLKITDFGIARLDRAREESAATAMEAGGVIEADRAAPMTVGGIGTYEYMAPEQWVDAHNVDARADIFAFGVCLYEMLCGRRPYEIAAGSRQEPPDPRQVRGDDSLPGRLCEVMKRCVDWEREQRPASCAELRQELCGIYEELFHQPSLFAILPELSLKADGLNNRAVSYLQLGRETEAIKCWEEALKEDPQHLEATFNLGYLRWQKGEIGDDVYVKQMRELEGSKRANADYWRCLLWIHYERGDVDAIEEIQQSEHRVEDEEFKKALEDENKAVGRLLRVFEGHTGSVWSVGFSPDGRYAVSGSRDKTLRLWDVETGNQVRCFEGHTGGINSVSFSPDGRYVLSGGLDNTLRLWDVETGNQIRCFEGHTHCVASVSFSPDGRYALSGSLDKTLRLWDVETGREIRCFERHIDPVYSVSISADGRYALSGSWDHTLRLWEVEMGHEIRRFVGHTDMVLSVSLSPDGRHALSGSRDNTLRLWDVESGCEIRGFAGHTGGINSVSFSPDGRYALSGSADNSLRLWDVETGNQVRCFEGHTHCVASVSFSPDGRYALSGSYDQNLKLWELDYSDKKWQAISPYPLLCSVRDVGELLTEREEITERLRSVRKSMDLGYYRESYLKLREVQFVKGYERDRDVVELLTACGMKGRRKGLNAAWQRRLFAEHTSPVTSVSFSPDGWYVLSGGRDNTLRLREVETGQEIRRFEAYSESVSFSPDGQYVLSGGLDKILILWDVEAGHEIKCFAGHTAWVSSVSFSPDGRYVLSGSSDKTLRMWDMETGHEIRRFAGHTGSVWSVGFSPDGRYALSGSDDNTLMLWDVETGHEIRCFEGHTGDVSSVSFSPDGRYAMSGSDDSTARLWDVESGHEMERFKGHTNRVNSVNFSPDGRYALSGSRDHTLRLWDVETGHEIWRFVGHTGEVNSVSFSPDGRYALSGSADKTLRLWEFDWEWEF